MKAVVAAFNQEKALVGAFSVLTNLRMELFQALISRHTQPLPCRGGWRQRPDLHTSDRTLSTWNIRQHIKQQHTTRHIKHSTSDKAGQLRRVRLTAELRLSAVTPKSCFWHWSRLRGCAAARLAGRRCQLSCRYSLLSSAAHIAIISRLAGPLQQHAVSVEKSW